MDERKYTSIAAAAGRAAPGHRTAGGAVKVPAAWLIEQSGFSRGHRDGRVGLSSKHPLAIVNRGGASARDVLAFAALVRRRVFDRFGVSLKAEPVFVALDDDADAAYLQQEAG
jgi:UDP-N-acetylmuramate dehydrogenase